MKLIFDSHAHYDDAAFEEDRAVLLSALPERGVCGVINAGCDAVSSGRSVALAEAYPYIYAAVGWHPEAAAGFTETAWQEMLPLFSHTKVVAVGEIGLDYHYEDACPREQQKLCFERQLQYACEQGLPVIVHDREAHEDTMALLRKYRPKGVLHCFSGSVEMMQEAVKLGLYIGLGGAVTFKNARKPVEVASAVPFDRLLLETDCPYMAPVPFRGKRCDSAMIAETAVRIAEIRGVSAETVLAQTRENVKMLFGI